MIRKYILGTMMIFLATTSFAMGNSQDQDKTVTTNPAASQARQDYRVLMQELKKMGEQYNQVTGQVKEVIKEEGVPVWNEQTGGFEMKHDLDFAEATGPIKETETEIRVVLDLPGVKKNTLKVNVEDDTQLRVQGIRVVDNQEIAVSRLVALPASVNSKNPKAVYQDGVLTVTLQKLTAPKKVVSVPIQ